MTHVAVDVGGTHTDLYARSAAGSVSSKVPTTPADPTQGVMDAIDRAGVELAEVESFLHGSTITTNALIEGTYPETAFVTTEGFRDVIEIGRYHRPELYNPYQTKPDPLVPRRHRYTVTERLTADGAVDTPLDVEEVRELADELAEAGFESVAVGFVNSYVSDEHERRAAEVLEECTDLAVARSAAIAPTLGMLERFSTTIINAALSPLLRAYLVDLEAELTGAGFDGEFAVIKSNGGLMTAGRAVDHAETTVLSGPAAGARGASFVGEAIDQPNVIGMDMGGTSTDVSLTEAGEPLVTTEYEVKFDIPIGVPMIDVNTIGSGGGTIAWIDDGGSLRVGPESAGADPGPACYPGGGEAPTITDANLLLGRLNADNFLGGAVRLDVPTARTAIEGLADRLDMDVETAAAGVLEIANERMAAALREVTIERGRDPRDYSLVGFGGCGPMHAPMVARRLSIPQVIVPSVSGVLSAFAGTAMDVQYDETTAYHTPADDVDPDRLNATLADLDRRARELIGAEFAGGETEVDRTAEMRYVGQTYDLDVPLPGGELDESDVESVVDAFHEIHETEYGVANRDFAVEFVNLRSRSTARFDRASLQRDADEAREGTADEPRQREVYFDGQWHETPVYDRSALTADRALDTPAIVEDDVATTVIGPGMAATTDAFGNILVDTGVRST